MKKYKTFGEFLKYVKDNMSDAMFENVMFRFRFCGADNYCDNVYNTTVTLLETIYPIEVIDATVLQLDVYYKSGAACVTMILLVH